MFAVTAHMNTAKTNGRAYSQSFIHTQKYLDTDKVYLQKQKQISSINSIKSSKQSLVH